MSYNKGSSSSGFGFSGFKMNARTSSRTVAIPPPPTAAISKQGYSTMSAITSNALSTTWGVPKKRAKTEEE